MPWTKLCLAAICLSCALVSAAPVYDPYETRHSLPPGWVKRQRVEPHAVHEVQIALAMGNLDKGDDCLMDVSDPDSLNYGKHWTAQQVEDFFRPTVETVDSVRQWIEQSLARTISHTLTNGHLRFAATNTELESLLETEFHYHHHELGRRNVPATHAYHIPHDVRRHVDYITPGVLLPRFSESRRTKHKKQDGPVSSIQERGVLDQRDKPCNGSQMSPQCIKKLYGIPDTPPKVVAGYEHAIYICGLSAWDQASLDTFFFSQTDIPNGTHPGKSYNIDGAPEPVTTETIHFPELNIDLQVTYPLLYPTEIVLLNEGPKEYQQKRPGSQNLMLDALDGESSYCNYTAFNETGDLPGYGGEVLNKECGTINPPKVIASPWDGQEDSFPLAWQRRQCNEFMKLGLQGVSFFYSSGDSGITERDGTCFGPDADVWAVPWPASCPYVTGVGGTQIKDGADPADPDSNPEEGLYGKGPDKLLTSSGGISAIYDRPYWQKDAVGNYLANTKIDAGGFSALAPDLANPAMLNATIDRIYTKGVSGGGHGHYSLLGRGVPDISAFGDAAYIWTYGSEFSRAGGTSASVHVVASIISRINLERMSIGKGPVGFINPVLYKHADTIIRDITDGHANQGNVAK